MISHCRTAAALVALLLLSGCGVASAVGSVASTAVSTAGTVVGTTVDVATYPVRR